MILLLGFVLSGHHRHTGSPRLHGQAAGTLTPQPGPTAVPFPFLSVPESWHLPYHTVNVNVFGNILKFEICYFQKVENQAVLPS